MFLKPKNSRGKVIFRQVNRAQGYLSSRASSTVRITSEVRNRKGAESGLVLESNSVLHKSFSLRIVSIPVSMQWNTIQHWIYCTFGLKDSTALSPNDLRYLQMELLTGTKTCWSKQAQGMYRKQNIAKAQRTRGLSSVVTKLTSF